MNIDTFWELVGKSNRSTSDCDEQGAKLITMLEKLEPSEIIHFQQLLWERIFEAYRWDWWAVAYIVNGGCSDDGFEYFRCWVIAQGRKFFGEALQNPESIVKKIEAGEEVECEPILYAALQAYENKTGTEMPPLNLNFPKEPRGQKWREEDLEQMYPKLCQRFW